jgi:hypothetical protein
LNNGDYAETAQAGDRFGASLMWADTIGNGTNSLFVGYPSQEAVWTVDSMTNESRLLTWTTAILNEEDADEEHNDKWGVGIWGGASWQNPAGEITWNETAWSE